MTTRMPWGKFKGEGLEDVPLSYLCWVLEECDNAPCYLRAAIKAELADRLGLAAPAPRPGPRGLDAGRLADALARWHRAAARRWHPDAGGSDQAMTVVNTVHDELRQLIAAG
jgi:hypothetical protein